MLGRECDDLLTKIDDLLNTEVLTFDKAFDFNRAASDQAFDNVTPTIGTSESDANFGAYDL